MKIDDRKSIDQSISVDNCLLIDIVWHRPIDDQSIVTNEISLITSIAIDCYRLPSIAIDCHRLPSIDIGISQLTWGSMTLDLLMSHKIFRHRLVIHFQCQSINWHRLLSIDIDYQFHRLVTPGCWASIFVVP